MGSSRSSSERTRSVGSHPEQQHQKKPSLTTKNDPNLALREEQPSKFSDPMLMDLTNSISGYWRTCWILALV